MGQNFGACFRLHPDGVEISMKSSLRLRFLPVHRPRQPKTKTHANLQPVKNRDYTFDVDILDGSRVLLKLRDIDPTFRFAFG